MRSAQFTGVLPELGRQELAQLDRRGGSSRFRHQILGDYAVFCHEAAEHIPLAAVSDRIFQKKAHHAAVRRFIQRLQHVLQEIVGLLQFVIEQGIVLGQLHVIEVQLRHQIQAHDIEGGEHPAPAGLLLVADLPGLHFDAEGEGVVLLHRVISRGAEHACLRSGVHCHSVDPALVELRFKSL